MQEAKASTPAAVVALPPSHESGLMSKKRSDMAKLALGALGVVYGDIGTSPLYALKECVTAPHGVAPLPANIYGLLSLFFWSITLVVSVKYILYGMRADNNGEGGVLALMALAARVGQQKIEAESPKGKRPKRSWQEVKRARVPLIMLGLFGSALLYGDGVITPAISVLSAVEGLDIALPALHPYVLILIALFWVQKRGTGGIGAVFGPVTLCWFVAIAAMGLPWVVRHPQILTAVNPVHAVRFFAAHGKHGFLVLGSVVLCITGGEALYADMGHFGTRGLPGTAACFLRFCSTTSGRVLSCSSGPKRSSIRSTRWCRRRGFTPWLVSPPRPPSWRRRL